MTTNKKPAWSFNRPYQFGVGKDASEGAITINLFPRDGVNLTEEDASKVADEIATRNLYWSDDRCCHWFFDFKSKATGFWVSGGGIDEGGLIWNVTISV